MGVSGIGTAGYQAAGYTARKAERNAESQAVGFMETVAEKATQDNAVDHDEKAFEMVGPHAPQKVKDAWMEAAKEVNANGTGIKKNGMMSHISQMMIQRCNKMLRGETDYSDILGSTVESAIRATKKALYDLDHPLAPAHRSIEAEQARIKEREFYAAFLEKLNVATTKSTPNINSTDKFALEKTSGTQELSEAEEMELFKKEFYEDLSKITIHKTLSNVAVNISEAGFKAMKDDPEYREKFLSLLQRDLGSSLPRNCSAVFTVGATLSEYRGDSWPVGYDSEFYARSQNSFYKKTSEKKKRREEYARLNEESAWKRKLQEQEANERYYQSRIIKKAVFGAYQSGFLTVDTNIFTGRMRQ